MIPNKKILNPKNNSPWLLCPSKSFPGKFYYFNGSTGETAWCLSETDKNAKKDSIHKVTDKTHTYPEPFGPPIDESTNTTNSFTSLKNVSSSTEFVKNAKENHPRYPIPSPSFGQAVFPKYVSPDIFTPKVIWALTPMYVPDQPQPQRKMFDQITQTYESEKPMFVQTSSVPLNNRFQTIKRTLNFTPDAFQFNQTPFQYYDKEQPMFDQTLSFSAFKPKETSSLNTKPQMKDEACQTFVPTRPKRLRTQSESDSTPKSVLKPSRSVENLTTLFTKDVETSTLSPPHKVDNKLSELDKNDLRFLLVAKKKKVKFGDTLKSTQDQSKPHKTREALPSKKRVTFDLQDPGETSSEEQEIEQSPDSQAEVQNPPAPPVRRMWYVVPDTEVLIAELAFIEEYVKSDSHCRLLVAHAVVAQLTARGRGDGGAVPARRLLRSLAHCDHIVVQSKPEYELASPEDSILQCCWDLVKENHRVVLITDNAIMLNNAKIIDLECHTLEEIKNVKHPEPVPQIDIKKIKIVVKNDKKQMENLFMQDLSQINGFTFTKANGFSMNESRINIFSPEAKTVNVFSKNYTNTDKFTDLTKTNNITTLNSEMTNVKDQIRKLTIAENTPMQNRTKKIMKNLFCNAGVSKIDQNTNFIDEIDRDIQKLNMAGNKETDKDTIVSGITKLNNDFNIDKDLERFYVKNATMQNRVKSRIDEWICRLNQIMEWILTDVLLKENAKVKGMSPPWSLFEAIQVAGETYKKQHNIKIIIDRYSIKLLNCSSNVGKLIKNMKPDDFMKLAGFSMILIQHLKQILNWKELYEAEDMISDLIKDIEDPNTDIDLSLEKFNTPILSRSDDLDPKVTVAFRKSRTEVLDYLKKHFAAWKAYDEGNPKQINNNEQTNVVYDTEPNVVRTFGKNLNMLKINNTKAITVENNDYKINCNNEPKVIRNLKIIDAFEERLKNKELNLDELDYDESVQTISSDDESNVENNKTSGIRGFNADNVKARDLTEYTSILDDLSVSVSSCTDTECVRAYPLAKIFLVKMKRTLILICSFIKKSMQDYQDGMPLDNKRDVQIKTEIARQYVLKMSERLKSIIARESGNGTTLKDLLIKAGDYTEDDKTITNYKEIIIKYLEQAEIVEEALKIMLSLPNTGPKDKDTRCCDSLDSTSPILPSRVLRSNKMVKLTNAG